MLIRWISTEVRIFAYLQNTVLVVCFLGLGMGCLTSRREARVGQAFGPLAMLVTLMAIPTTREWLGMITTLLTALQSIVIWDTAAPMDTTTAVQNVGYGLVLTFVLMYLIWNVFVPFGRCLGRWIDESSNTIAAYSWNVAGSLLGILLFSLLSVLQQPPVVWCLFVVAMFVPLAMEPAAWRKLELASLLVIVVGAWFAGATPHARETHWSPYQKLTLFDIEEQKSAGNSNEILRVGKHLVGVNSVGYQSIIDLSTEHVTKHPSLFPADLVGLSQYDIPCQFHSRPQRVLVVGAGTGNDVAGVLRNGAEEVVAVEIDPAIISMGRRLHPERPYDSSKVQLVLDDARSYMAGAKEPFDVILFGLLDSHTTSATTNTRLDHFVYTRQCIEQAKSLLKDDGVLVLSFMVEYPYIAARMSRMLGEVFGREPLAVRIPPSNSGWGGLMFVTGSVTTLEKQFAANPRLANQIAEWRKSTDPIAKSNVEITTDDWPYLYLETRHVPVMYFLLAGLLSALFIHGMWKEKAWELVTGWQANHWHFFFLGAAFMLLEVQNISKACVVLGSTWWVNAVIISAILIMVLAANFLASRFPSIPDRAVYGALCLCCSGLYFVDLASFAFLPFAVKTVLVGGLTCLPMLFSGVVFIRSFAAVERKDVALGANLFGSLFGALLQTVTFLTGIKALLLFVVCLYLMALVTKRSAKRTALRTDKREAEMVPAAG